MTLNLPMLTFDSLVESDDEGSVNTRLGVMATVTNSGDAPATFLYHAQQTEMTQTSDYRFLTPLRQEKLLRFR